MKPAITLFASILAAAVLTGCGTLTAAKSKIHEWTAPEIVAPDVGGKGAGGGGAMRR
jgi:hypothetical protein